QMDRLAFTALTWRECVTAAREAGRRLPAGRYLEVRFEDVVREPRETVPQLLEFMQLPPAREIDEFIERKIDATVAGKWVHRFNEAQVAQILPYVEELCHQFGYLSQEQIAPPAAAPGAAR